MNHVLVLGPLVLPLELLLAVAAIAAAFGAARLAAGAHARDVHATLTRAVALGALVARAATRESPGRRRIGAVESCPSPA